MAFGDVSPATYYRYSYSSDRPAELASATGYRGTDPSSTANPLPGRGFSFTYDTAGNRKGAGVDTDAVSYTDGSGNAGGNNLNQTKQRGTLKTRVSGAAHASTTVTVGGATASRSDRYWDYALPNYAQYTSVGITAALSGQSQSGSVQALTRPATESLSYDADGNLTSDSLWTYEYDAENRLKRMYTNASAITWGAPDRELLFTYDYFGRRARKIAKLNGTPTYDRKFVYEGWRLLAEIESSTGKVVRTYTWGLDLASSLSSTGGVGGLILETVHTDTTLTAYHVTSDASGNVTALVNPVSGAVAAAYEYGPFGETVRAQTSDTTLAYQPIRFSTKFTDSETGLVYYGRRYYDPSLGRFINRDPIAESGGINLYAFIGNAPMNGIEFHGMWPKWVARLFGLDNDQFDRNRDNKLERASEEIAKLEEFGEDRLNDDTDSETRIDEVFAEYDGAKVVLDELAYRFDRFVQYLEWKSYVATGDHQFAKAEAIILSGEIPGMGVAARSGAARAASAAKKFAPLANNEIVVIGNGGKPGNFILREGIDTRPIGSVTIPGKSATIATDLTLKTEFQQMFDRAPKTGDILGGAFVEDIRAAGFDVVRAPTEANALHVRIVSGERIFDSTGRDWLSLAFDRLGQVKK